MPSINSTPDSVGPQFTPVEPEACFDTEAASTQSANASATAKSERPAKAQETSETDADTVEEHAGHGVMGEALEKHWGRTLDQLPPGGKVTMSLEGEGGEELEGGGEVKLELEREKDGGYVATLENKGQFGAGYEVPGASAHVAATAGAAVTLHFESREEAASALSAMTQKAGELATSQMPLAGALFGMAEDRDVNARLVNSMKHVRSVEFGVGAEVAGKFGTEGSPLELEAHAKADGDVRYSVNFETGELARELSLKGNVGAGAELGVGDEKKGGKISFGFEDKAKVDGQLVMRQSVTLPPDELAQVKAGKLSVMDAAKKVAGSFTTTFEERVSVRVGDRVLHGQRGIDSHASLKDTMKFAADSALTARYEWSAAEIHTDERKLAVPGAKIAGGTERETPLFTSEGTPLEAFTQLCERSNQAVADQRSLAALMATHRL